MYNFKGKLDDKNRLTIPAEVRSEFEGILIITPGFDGSLHLYTENVWKEELEPALTVNPQGDDRTPAILNQHLAAQADFFYSDLQTTRLDEKRGRITLEQDLMVRAGLHEVRDYKAIKMPATTGHYWKIRRADRRPTL